MTYTIYRFFLNTVLLLPIFIYLRTKVFELPTPFYLVFELIVKKKYFV
jgi:hypothetical protein